MPNATLYNMTSPKNKIGKNKTQVGSEYGIVLKEPCSILRPVLRLRTSDSVYTANYLYIDTFARYYFIDDIVSIHHNEWEISAHVDVLDTYSADIKSNSAVIKRQANKFNLYLDDPEFHVYANEMVQTKKLSKTDFDKNLTYVLVVNGS